MWREEEEESCAALLCPKGPPQTHQHNDNLNDNGMITVAGVLAAAAVVLLQHKG